MGQQYNYITSDELIGRVANGFTIDNSQWIYNAPLWIADGLAQLKILQTFQYMATEAYVEGYRCELPCNLKLLIAIEYQGTRLNRLGIFNNMSATQLAARGYNSDEGYEVVGDNWITTTFPEGTIIFHYRIPPVAYSKTLNMYAPKIPNDPYVIEALNWYIILKILYLGFKHPVFSLDSNNAFTNPGLQWEKNKPRARNSVNIIDADEMYNISLLFQRFIQRYNSHHTGMFNGKGTANGGELTLMESVTTNYNSTIVDNILVTNKYVKVVSNQSTVTITATEHKCGVNVIPVFFELVDGAYVKVLTEFIVDLAGNVTWNGSTSVVNGYIILI